MESLGFYLKKTNAAAAFLVLLALCGHAGTMCVSLWTGWYNLIIAKTCATVTVIALAIHVLISLSLFFFFHDGAALRYSRENRTVILQRLSAMAILILLHVHMTAYSHMAAGETLTTAKTLFYCTTELLFFASVMTHVAVSFSKGLVTLGLAASPESVRKADVGAYVVCAAVMIAASGGILSFFLGGAP